MCIKNKTSLIRIKENLRNILKEFADIFLRKETKRSAEIKDWRSLNKANGNRWFRKGHWNYTLISNPRKWKAWIKVSGD